MTRALEAEGWSGSSRHHGSILMWISTQGDARPSMALIDNFVVSGSIEQVSRCIEAAQNKRESFYDNGDARDVLNRLPKGDGFKLAAGVRLAEEQPGRLAWAECWHFASFGNASPTRTTVEKYGDVDSATARVARLEAERAHQGDPPSFEISQTGVFVTYTRLVSRY
jgi:hypothetical protein